MMIRGPGVAEVMLMPGDYFVGDAGYRPRTLLGSCVSITLWHRAQRIGAMSHFLLAARTCHDEGIDGRYGDEALQLMTIKLATFGVNAAECEAKIFGGASMMAGGLNDTVQVGQKNGTAARLLLRQAGIAVVSESLYGHGHRNIIFDIASGDVWARQIKPAVPAPMPERMRA